MKLVEFSNNGYIFRLKFEDGTCIESNLKALLQQKVSPSSLNTAQIDPEWGCLEFDNGLIDIEPKTLFNYCISHSIN